MIQPFGRAELATRMEPGRARWGVALFRALALGVSLLLGGCSPSPGLAGTATAGAPANPPSRVTPTIAVSPTRTAATLLPLPVLSGIELLVVPISIPGVDEAEALIVARVDPKKVDVRVRYAPKRPMSVRDWLSETGADVVVNAGYFTQENVATGLLISDGAVSGQTYRGFGGLFSVRAGPPQAIGLQWLKEQPYVADRRMTQAVESFPMLVQGGKVVPGINDDGRRNRRTFVALDKSGRLLLGVSRLASLTLSDLAAALAAAPALSVDAALNLDGGASSGLWARSPGDALSIESFDTVPAVITVSARR